MRRPSVPHQQPREQASEPLAVEELEPVVVDSVAEAATVPIEPLDGKAIVADLDAHPTEPLDLGERAGAASDVEPDPESADEQPVTARDVYRATRARKRAQREQARRFTARSRHKRWVRIGVITGVLALIAGIVAIAFSPLFAVRQVVIVGADDVLSAQMSNALQQHVGTPLALVDFDSVRETVETFPLVETYQVEARPPHDLLVRVVQRSPIGVVRAGGGYALIDAAGVVLSNVAEIPSDLPLIDIDAQASPRAFEAAGHALRALSDGLRALAIEVTGSTGDDTIVRLSSGIGIMWGSGDESALKGIVLDQLMAANPGATWFDVSAPDVPVVG